MQKDLCVLQPDLPKLNPIESILLILVAIVQVAKKVPQVYDIDLVKMYAHAHLYHHLRSEFEFHEDILVHEKWCGDLRADVNTEHENDFGVDIEYLKKTLILIMVLRVRGKVLP